MNDAFAKVAQAQTKKNTSISTIKQKIKKQNTIAHVASLEGLSEEFDTEKVLTFKIPNSIDLVFTIRTMEPGRLILETGSPAYFDTARELSDNTEQTQQNVQHLPQSQQMTLIKEDLSHKRRTVVQGVIAPKLGMNGSEGYPVEELPTQILNELYANIMFSVDEGQDFLTDFYLKSQEKETKESLFLVYEMACRFHQRPYQFLFSSLQNPNIQFIIDTIIFNIGYEREKKEELEKLKLQVGGNAIKSALK